MIRPSLSHMAEIVDQGARTATPIAQFTNDHELDVADAYAVQALSIARRTARGERIVGVKMGLTSRAKMAQVGVDSVIWGRLTDGMLLADGATISLSGYVHPRVEPEIAFLIEHPLGGKVTGLQAIDAVGGIAAAAEVIDSRYENFKFALPDVIADNSSSSGFAVGDWHDRSTPIDNLGITLSVDGRIQEVGSSAAILGNPVRSLVEAARLVDHAGLRLEPGWIVLAGGATAAVPLAAGSSYRVSVESLGRVGFTVTD